MVEKNEHFDKRTIEKIEQNIKKRARFWKRLKEHGEKMITLFQIDKSGRDIFEKDYSIVLVVNKKEIYGCNISQSIKDTIMHQFKLGKLWKLSKNERIDKMRLRIRFHTVTAILLMNKAIKDLGFVDNLSIEICNDFDGHFHEIREMIYKNLAKLIPALSQEDIVQTKFQKPSLIDGAARNIRAKDKISKDYNLPELNIDEVIKMVRKWRQ